jgi:hypothetical protein
VLDAEDRKAGAEANGEAGSQNQYGRYASGMIL